MSLHPLWAPSTCRQQCHTNIQCVTLRTRCIHWFVNLKCSVVKSLWNVNNFQRIITFIHLKFCSISFALFLHIKCSLSIIMLCYHLELQVTQKQSMHWSLGWIPPSRKEAGLWHDVKDEEGGGGGGREREKKIWQIHKAVWLHCGHVAAFTTTVCTNLTSLLSSLRLSVFWKELPCFDPMQSMNMNLIHLFDSGSHSINHIIE